MIPAHAYDFVQWQPQSRKLYESNYLKANSPDGNRGFWIKHNILAPSDSGRPAMLEVWCVLFDRESDAPPLVAKQNVPMLEVVTAKTTLRIEGEGILLTDRATRTRLADEATGVQVHWDLKYRCNEPAIFHLPLAGMYTSTFPKKKIITPAPRAVFSGTITFGDETIEVADWVGIRGHNWGSEHAYAYAYGNCNLFREDPAAILEMFTAKIRIGPLKSPWLSGAILRLGGRELRFNRLRHAITRTALVEFPRWRVTLKGDGSPLEAEWELEPSQTVGLRYIHPDGSTSYCYNTKFARLNVRSGAEITLSTDQAELEFLFSEPVPGVPLWGNE